MEYTIEEIEKMAAVIGDCLHISPNRVFTTLTIKENDIHSFNSTIARYVRHSKRFLKRRIQVAVRKCTMEIWNARDSKRRAHRYNYN